MTFTPIIRPATAPDLITFFGQLPAVSVRAWVADLDGEVIGIAGVMLPADGPAVYFSDAKPALLRHHRKAIVRGVRLMLDAVGRRPGIAFCGGHPSVLAHFGFRHGANGVWTIG